MTTFEDKDKLQNQELDQRDNLIDVNYDLYYDHPRGWSYICLSETISYYSNNPIKKQVV